MHWVSQPSASFQVDAHAVLPGKHNTLWGKPHLPSCTYMSTPIFMIDRGESMTTLPPREYGQFCFFELLATDGWCIFGIWTYEPTTALVSHAGETGYYTEFLTYSMMALAYEVKCLSFFKARKKSHERTDYERIELINVHTCHFWVNVGAPRSYP